MTFEPKHDTDRLGSLLADPTDEATPDGKLCSLADLVAWVMCRDAGMPSRPAAALMVRDLGAAAPPLYLTNRDTWATRLQATHKWWTKADGRAGGVVCQVVKASAYRATDLGGSAYEAGPWQMLGGSGGASRFQERRKVVKPPAAMPGVDGEAGAWQVLRDAWCSDDRATRDKAMGKHRTTLERLAIPMRVAVKLFGYGQPAEAAPAGDAAAVGKVGKGLPPDALAPATDACGSTDALIVQPMGGAWPHLEGADWSAAEREAMFTMRHKHRMTGERIAKIACVSRVRVDELIGKVSSPKTHQWPDVCEWRPSATLLLACGFPVPQSLQAVPPSMQGHSASP